MIKIPYIKEEDRKRIRDDALCPQNAGELNYLITGICHEYIKEKGLCYATLNEVVGVLSCAQAELYRVVAAKYEDKKRLANGSVSELDAINLGDVR